MPAVWPSASTSPDDRFEQPLSRGVLKIGAPTRPQEKNNRRHTLLTRPAPSCGAALARGGDVEDYFDPRTKPGPGRVSTRRGWAGEKGIVFSILL